LRIVGSVGAFGGKVMGEIQQKPNGSTQHLVEPFDRPRIESVG